MNYLLLPLIIGTLISSDEASFVSDLLTLKGNVSISHSVGQFQADKVTVEKTAGDDNKLSHALFEEAVKISLPENRHIECDLADVDFTRLEAILRAQGEHFVTISDSKEDIYLKAKTMHCQFTNDNLHSLAGETLVELVISDLYHILADKVEYLADGSLHFSAPCTIQTPKETLTADDISYDIHTKTIALNNLAGVINGFRVTAKHTILCKESHKILLDEGAILEHPEIGLAVVPGVVELFLDEAERITQFVLNSSSEEKVNFTKDGLQMKADKLVVAFNKEDGKSKIHGEGLVTLSFPAKPKWKNDFVTKPAAS